MKQASGIFSRRWLLDRYLAPVLTAVALGVLITTLVAYFYTKNTVEHLAQEQISQTLNFLDREITLQARDMTSLVELMSREDLLHLALEDSHLGRSARVAAQRKLEAYVRNGSFDRVYLLDNAGKLVMASNPLLPGSLDVSDRQYYIKARAGRSTLETEAVSRVTGQPILVASTPLRSPEGTVLGVVVGLTHTETFAKPMLSDSHIGKTGGAYIMTAQGEMLGSPTWAAFDSIGPAGHVAELVANASSGAIHHFTRDGERRMCLSRRNEVTGWILVIEVGKDELLAPATRLAAVSGAISLITLVIVALALGALRRIMANLRNSETDHRTLTELSPVGIVTFGPTGAPEYMNRQARSILDLAPEAPLPKVIELEDSEGAPLLGETSPIACALTQHTPILGLLTWYKHPGGDRKALYLNAKPLVVEGREAHGVVATLEDITERMQPLELLHQSEERFSSLFRLSPDSIVLSDLDTGTVVDVNETFTDSFGLDREEVIGKTIAELALYGDENQLQEITERVKTEGHALNVLASAHGSNGEEIFLSLSSQVMEIGEKRYRMTVARDITERTRADQELGRNRRLLESILNTVPLSIFWKDRQSVFLGCNAAFARALGQSSPQDVVGKTDADLPIPAETSQSYRADDQAVMTSMEPKLRYVESLALNDGRTIWLETSKLPLVDDTGQAVGVLGIFEDITERVQAVEQLRQSEERFSRLFRFSPEAMSLVDMADQSFADANDAFQKLTGYSLQELVGRSSVHMGFYADESRRSELYQILEREGHVENFEFEGRRRDGQILQCSITSHVMAIADKRYLLALVRDMTEIKKMQEMMIQTEKMISIGGIAAGIAHEINNPLGIVLQAAQNMVQRTRPDFKKNLEVAAELGLDMELLRQYMQARKLDVFIEDIQAAAVRASAIIRHMLDFSRSSESKRRVCDLPAIIDKAIALASSDYDLKKSYDFKRIKITRDYSDDLIAVHCTETGIEQVLLNLLRNSAQALATSEPPVAEPLLVIRARNNDEFLRIEIEDNGPGMPPEVQRRVFEPFYTTKPPGVGTGLGLSVSYFIVTKGHGGRMTVESHPGAGTLFSIDLPADDINEEVA